MPYINDVLDKVYVINLDKDTKRLKDVDMKLQSHGIAYERFSAVLGAEVGQTRLLTDFCNKHCTDGMKGCALSHKKIWKEMLVHNYEYIMILEDDVLLDEFLDDEFERGWKQVPKDFDFLYLGCNFKCGDKFPVAKIINTVMDHEPKPVDKNVMEVAGSFGTFGYVISKQAAKKLLNAQIDTHFDVQIQRWKQEYNLKCYSLNPLIVKNNEEENTSNLSDSYPKLANSVFKRIQISDTLNLDWILGESFFKINKTNISPLMCLLFLAVLITPANYIWVYGAWLLAEYVASKDAKNTFRYAWFLSVAAVLKFVLAVAFGAGPRRK